MSLKNKNAKPANQIKENKIEATERHSVKLTETQINIIAAYQNEIGVLENQRAILKRKFDDALFLIVGREFNKYELTKDGLIIIDETLKEQK